MSWRLSIVLLFWIALQWPAVIFAAAAQADNSVVAGKNQESEVKPEAVDPWENVWSGQREMLNEINAKAAVLRDRVNVESVDLNKKLRPYEEEASRLLVLTTNFKDWPNPLEAVSRRISLTMRVVRQSLEPLVQARVDTQTLLDRVSQLADSLPEDVRSGRGNADMQAYLKFIAQVKARLAAVLTMYNRTLEPSSILLERLQKTQEEIASHLPVIWKDYYLHAPVPWLSVAVWAGVPEGMRYAIQGMSLRLPVELPVSEEQWTSAALRFIFGLIFCSFVAFILSRNLLTPESPPPARQIFRLSCPFLCVGFSLLAASFSAAGEFYRLLLALGNLTIIGGQICLAWDMRRLKYPEAGGGSAPFWRFMPLTFCAYGLLYLPLVRLITLASWGAFVIVALIFAHRRRGHSQCPLLLESSVIESESIVLWMCLVLTMFGLHTYSMALYLLFVSLSLALELCLGSMALISNLNGKLSSEGARAAVGHLLLALAAPLVLVAAVSSVLLWLATLPGGVYLLKEYLFKGINVGETQFNIIQLLLIISAFFLSRTAVSMGTRLLAKLPSQGMAVDATLIPPAQTAYTYAIWCVFGLFVLRFLGMELRNLAMVAGGLSVGIGFGMQTIVNNFISGLILIFSRMLQAGDVVEVGGVTGRVRKISVRATMVETFDNALIYVPNSEFVSSRLINWTRNSRSVRREIKVGVAYGSDTETVMKIILGIAKAHHNILKHPAPSAAFTDFGTSTLDFVLRFWVKDYDVGASTASDIRLEMEKQFRGQGIEVAFPQMDIRIKEMPSPGKKSALPPSGRQLRRVVKRPLRRVKNI